MMDRSNLYDAVEYQAYLIGDQLTRAILMAAFVQAGDHPETAAKRACDAAECLGAELTWRSKAASEASLPG